MNSTADVVIYVDTPRGQALKKAKEALQAEVNVLFDIKNMFNEANNHLILYSNALNNVERKGPEVDLRALEEEAEVRRRDTVWQCRETVEVFVLTLERSDRAIKNFDKALARYKRAYGRKAKKIDKESKE